MFVFLINVPNLVLRGSSAVVHCFFSSSAFCIRIDLNLYILKSFLLSPTLSCLKKTGPGEVILIITAVTIIRGDKRAISKNEHTISKNLLSRLLPRLSRGIYLILIIGRPSTSSTYGFAGMYL